MEVNKLWLLFRKTQHRATAPVLMVTEHTTTTATLDRTQNHKFTVNSLLNNKEITMISEEQYKSIKKDS